MCEGLNCGAQTGKLGKSLHIGKVVTDQVLVTGATQTLGQTGSDIAESGETAPINREIPALCAVFCVWEWGLTVEFKQGESGNPSI
jgi:hypothetical protein